jgi:energy-coupling factor transporter transmembrane protein EcfT
VAGTERAAAPPSTRIGPLSALAVSLLAVAGSFFVHTWQAGVVTLAGQLVLVAVVVADRPAFVRRLGPGMLAVLTVGFSSWLLGGRDLLTGLTAGLRILTLILPGLALVERMDPSALGDALATRVHLPARPVLASVAALQRLDALGDEWAELDRARRARGLGPGRGLIDRARHVAALTFGLLVVSLRRAARLAVAMDARGFAAAGSGRSWAEPSPWRWADTALLVAGIVLAALPGLSALALTDPLIP